MAKYSECTISDAIETLGDEAAEAGDQEMSDMCERAAQYCLYTANHKEFVAPRYDDYTDTHDVAEYVRVICDSLDTPESGAVLYRGLTVYAE
jgi:hypothetical protein